MIAVKLSEVIEATPAIFRVLATKLPVKPAYQLGKIGKRLQNELKEFNEAHFALVKELGAEVLDKDQKPTGDFKVAPENMAKFQEQYKELIDADVQIDLVPVKLEALGDKAEITPADLSACDKFIVE